MIIDWRLCLGPVARPKIIGGFTGDASLGIAHPL
jgi:hypothetical protein